MATLYTLVQGVASTPIAGTPGQALGVQIVSALSPTNIFVEGSFDGTNWSSIGTILASSSPSINTIDLRGSLYARLTLLNISVATVNVNPFGMAGALQSLQGNVPAFRPNYITFLGDSRVSTAWINAATADTFGNFIGWVRTSRLGSVDTGGFDAANDSYSAYSYPGVSLAGYAALSYWGNCGLNPIIKPDYVIEAFGFNDASQASIPLSDAALREFISQKEAFAKLLRSLGVRVIWATIYSAQPGNALYGQTKPSIDQMNASIRARAAAIGVPVWDVAALLDTQATSAWYTDDRHYGGVGQRQLAASCTNFLNALRPYVGGSIGWDSVVTPAAPALAQYENMGSGVTPASLGGYGGLTFTQTATQTDANALYTLNMAITGVSQTAVVLERTYTIGVDRAGATGSAIAVGDHLLWSWDYILSQALAHIDDGTGLSMSCQVTCAGAALSRTKVYNNFICNSAWSKHMDVFTVPAGTTTIKFQIRLDGGTGSVGSAFSVRNIAVWNLSKMGGIPK